MATKDTNPKDALGVKKVPLHAVPCGPLLELGLAMLEGGCKYGTHNYRESGCRHSVYYDSTVRHMIDWWEGQNIDPDSGVHHITKTIAGLIVLRDSMLMGNDVDDRPLRYPGGLKMDEFNKTAADILDKYPEKKEPFTQSRRDYETLNAARPTALKEFMTEKLDGARVSLSDALGITQQQANEVAEATLKDMTPISSGSSLTDMPELEDIPDGTVVPVSDVDKGIQVKDLLEPVVLPDDNKVIESDEENSCRNVTDPKRRMFCTVGGCFNKGIPNQGEPYIYRCPAHPIKKGD